MKSHPMAPTIIEAEIMATYEYAQLCAQTLVNNELMTKMEHKTFIKRLEKWLASNGIIFETKHR